jgi:hypothetical protein
MIEATALDWIEVNGNELEACRSIKRAKSMLFNRGRGETVSEIDSTSPSGYNITSQMREPAGLFLQHITDFVALLDGSLRRANFLFHPSSQILDDPAYS